MPTDRTRPSDDRRQGYRGVRFQQGRVILDRDLNAAEELTAEELRDVTRDVVGPVGTPDNGFMIAPLDKDTKTKRPFDFSIAAGTYYVGGVRVSFAQPSTGQSVTYFNQPNWLHPDWISAEEEKALREQEWSEFVGLQIQEVEVSAQEDPDLKDVALGGPDTTGRLSLLVRVVRMRVDGAQDCTGAFKFAKERWAKQGLRFDENTNQLIPLGNLQVGITQTAQTSLCQPQASGAYLHPNNQNIRVKSVQIDETQQLLWGFDNASFLYRVDKRLDSRTLTLATSPPDPTRFPKQDQFVEVLRTTAQLPNGGAMAESEGFITKLSSDYKSETGTITLDDHLPADMVNSTTPLFVRLWENTLAIPADKSSLDAISDPSGPTGLTITVPANPLPMGAYWTFAPRPATPQTVYPERYFLAPQTPEGPRAWFAPLAFLKWAKEGILSQDSVSDCRDVFDNLVELTKNRTKSTVSGCCEVTVTPADVEQAGGLNGLFKKLRAQKLGRLHICFRPGVYFLREPLVLDADFSGVILSGCPGTKWEATIDADAPLDVMLDGMLVLAGCENATVKGIHFIPPAIPVLAAFEVRKVPANAIGQIRKEFGDVLSAVVVRAINAKQLSVEGCEFSFPIASFAVFATAVFAHGDCTGLKMKNCRTNQPRVDRLPDPNAENRGEISRNNLRQLALAIRNFIETGVGEFIKTPPRNLGDLLPFTDNSAQLFVHPFMEKNPPPTLPREQLPEWVNKNTDYVYLSFTKRSELTSARVLLHEKPIAGMTNLNVALGDGSVVSLEFDVARELIARSGGELVGLPKIPGTRGWFAVLACHQRFKTDANNQVTYCLQPLLDDLVLAENTFVGLSVPFLGIGNIGTVAVRANHATDCTGGAWFSPTTSTLTGSFLETRFAAAVIDTFPLARSGELPDAESRRLNFAIRVVDNHFEAIPNDRVFSAPTVCLLGDLPTVELAPVSDVIASMPIKSILFRQALPPSADRQTVIISGNNLRALPGIASRPTTFTALFDATVVVLNISGTSITSNVIESESLGNELSKSLVIFPSVGGKTPGDKVTVTGNIFRGSTNLDSLLRSNNKPLWRDYNSEI